MSDLLFAMLIAVTAINCFFVWLGQAAWKGVMQANRNVLDLCEQMNKQSQTTTKLYESLIKHLEQECK